MTNKATGNVYVSLFSSFQIWAFLPGYLVTYWKQGNKSRQGGGGRGGGQGDGNNQKVKPDERKITREAGLARQAG